MGMSLISSVKQPPSATFFGWMVFIFLPQHCLQNGTTPPQFFAEWFQTPIPIHKSLNFSKTKSTTEGMMQHLLEKSLVHFPT